MSWRSRRRKRSLRRTETDATARVVCGHYTRMLVITPGRCTSCQRFKREKEGIASRNDDHDCHVNFSTVHISYAVCVMVRCEMHSYDISTALVDRTKVFDVLSTVERDLRTTLVANTYYSK
jgi:hypothetical protein